MFKGVKRCKQYKWLPVAFTKMNKLPRSEPHVTTSGLKIYDLDYSLPREYIPSINIPTIITEDNHIKIDPSWEKRYREVYAHYHQTEHIDKGVDERVYVSLEKILKFAKMWSSLVGIQTWAPDEEFADQHSCLCAQGYGHTYISIISTILRVRVLNHQGPCCTQKIFIIYKRTRQIMNIATFICK